MTDTWPTYRTIGALIAGRRAELGLSLRDVAGKVGVSRSYISDIENGRGRLTADATIRALADALQVDPDVVYAHAGVVPEDIRVTLGTLSARQLGILREQLRDLTGSPAK